MKKTLVAIAALAVVGAASAQSSVTLYGRIDASLASNKTSNTPNALGVPVTGATTDGGALIRSGGHTGSRWGLRGSEDLGGGMKANFQLEQGFNVDDGAASAAARQFHRQAWVGLSGGFGALTVGRQYDITDNMYAMYDAAGYSGYSAMGYAFNVGCGTVGLGAGGTGDCVGRQNNAVLYSTPSMGGFGVTAMWAPGENKTAATSAGRALGVMANYANGPLAAGIGFQSNKDTGAARTTTNTVLGGSYDLGAAKLYAMFENGKNRTTAGKDTGYSIGAVMPLGAASVTVAYAAEKQKIAGNKVSDSTGLTLMGKYDLSKRTYVYAAYLRGETDPVAAGISTVKVQNYGVGLVHNF